MAKLEQTTAQFAIGNTPHKLQRTRNQVIILSARKDTCELLISKVQNFFQSGATAKAA
jgi:hypothetical protein